VKEIIPGIELSEFNWIAAYSDVAVNQIQKEFTQYSEPLRKWFRVNAFSPEKYYFITLFEVIDHNHDLNMIIERLELAIDAGDHGFWDYDIDTGAAYFSSAYFSMLGYEDKELPMSFDTWRDLLHPNDRDEALYRVQHSIDNRMPYDIEFRLRCKDGSYKWIQAKGKSYEIDQSGKPHRAVGIHYDINDKKNTKEELRKSEIKYKELIDFAQTVILHMDRFGLITFINEYGIKLFGFSKGELLGKNVVGTIVPETESSGKDLLTLIEKIGNDPKSFSYNENENITKNNERLWIAWTNQVVLDENGEVEGIISYGTDITEKKKNEEILERFFDINLDLLCIADMKGHFLKVNKEWEYTLGYTKEFLEQSKFLDFVHPDDMGSTLDALKDLENNNDVIGFTNRYECSNGSVKYIEWKSHPSGDLIYAAARDITERIEQEKLLKESNATLSKLTNQVPGVIYQYLMRPDGTSCFPFSSEGMYDIYEVSPSEVKDDASVVFTRIHKDDLERAVESINESFKTLRLWSCEYRVILPVKGLRWLSGIARPELQSDGSVLWYGYINDITDRKQVEEKLKESEEKFSKIGNSALDAVIMINDHGAIEYWNPSAERIFGYKAGDVYGKNLHELLMPDIYREQYEKGWKEFLHTGKGNAVGKVLELTSIRSDGEYFPIEIALSSVLVKDKYWASAYVRDITDRKNAEKQILETKQQFELAVKGTNDGIWDWDIRENTLFLSKRWKEMLGYEEHELVNKFDTFVNLLHKEDQPKVSNYVQRYLNGEIDKYEIEFRMIHKDGTIRWILAKGEALRTEKGFPYRMAGSHSDITKRKLQEEKIWEQNAYIESILNAIPDLMFILDRNGVFIDLKEGHDDELYLPKEIFIGKKIHEVLPDPLASQIASAISDLINGKKVEPIQYKLPVKNKMRDYEARFTLAGDNSVIGMVRDITDQRKAEEKLKLSEQNFRNLFESMDDMIFIATAEGELLFVNHSVHSKLGYTFEELNEIGLLGVHPPNRLEEAKQIFAEMFNNERDSCPLPLQTKDGKLIPVETRVWFGTWDEREVVFGLSKDLSMLQAALEKFNKLFDSNPALMAVNSMEDNTFIEVNESFLNTLGFTKDEVIGKTIKEMGLFTNENQQKKVREQLTEFGNIRNIELDVKTKDGTILTGLFSGEIIDNQYETFMLTVMTDITAQKKAEMELKRQFELQDLLMNIAAKYINIPISEYQETIEKSLHDLGLFTDADRAYIFDYDWENDVCNNTYEWCREGITPQLDELQGVPLAMLTEWVNTHKKGEIMYIQDVNSLPEEDGTRQILEPQDVKSLIALPLMKGKECIGFVGFDSVRHHHEYSFVEKMLLSVFAEMLVNIRIRTILENNLIKEKIRAESANRAKSEFLANMSHEIRTPMNSILGFSEVMLNSVSDQKHKGYLNTILNSGKTLLSLINDILDLSKIEAGRLEISAEPVDLKVVLFEMQQIFAQKAEEKNIDLFFEIEEGIPSNITIDEIRLRQILLNLIGNAVKFTSSGFVKVIAFGDCKNNSFIDLHISVIDSGIGIPEADQKRIFDSFSQQAGQDSRKYGGTGLGLAITKRLCELMDGKISLVSQVNKGSKFTVTFQNVKCSDDVIVDDRGFEWDEDRIDFKPAKVLIVDDIPHNRNLVLSYLENYNLTMYEAENGEIAINIGKEYMPDLILMDIRMPGMNGYQATEILKSDKATQKIPVIALTASTMHSETDMINELFDGYLRKPIQKQHLVNEMAKFLTHDILEGEEFKEKAIEIEEVIEDVISEEVKSSFRGKFFDKIDYLKDVMIIDEVNDLS
jgi:PAS domain S-box-containing protein